jgi:site-specific DNA recombinase
MNMQYENGRGRRVAIYSRVSTSGQEDNASLSTQEAACDLFAAERGWMVAARFQDVHTGIDLFERPQLSRLRELMRQRRIDVVLCYSTDRLSRDPVHLGLVQYEATYYGIELAFVTDTYDTSLEGQMLAMVRGIAGKIEHERLKDRSRRGMQGRLAKGLLLVGNKAPYGYAWPEGPKTHLVVNEPEAEVLRDAFRRIAVGTPIRTVVRELNSRGVATSTGRGVWVAQTLTRMLRNPLYVGRRVALEREYFDEQVAGVGRKKKHRKRTEGTIVMEDVAPPVIEEEIYSAVQHRLALNKERSIRNNREPKRSLLRGGIARCGYCGNALQLNRCYGTRLQYVCRTRYERSDCPAFGIDSHILDQAVWERVERLLLDPDVIAREVSRQREQGFDLRLLRSAERRVADAERKRQNLIKRLAAIDDDAIAGAVQCEIANLQGDINTARDVVTELQREQAHWEFSHTQFTDLRTRIGQVAANIAALDYDGKRLALDALGVVVKLWAATHEPRYEISMKLFCPDSGVDSTRTLILD